jgi:glycosyltransferase involved in cell wall biosynthesis
MTKLDLSIVIAVLNKEESLPHLLPKIRAALAPLGSGYEIIFVDDGSSDRSREIISSFEKGSSGVQLVPLGRHAGKSEAWNAGFIRACGEIIITMDADLQNDPEDIPLFLERIREGCDLVSGWCRERRDSMIKRAVSRVANALLSRMSGLKAHDLACGFKAFRKQALEDIHLERGDHRFIQILLEKRGLRAAEIPIRHHARLYGRSRYRFRLPEVVSALIRNRRLFSGP